MLGMGWGEIGFVLVIALIVLGPEKIPTVARTLGKAVRMLRKATNDLRRAVEIEGVRDDIRAQIEGVKSSIPDPYAAVRAEEKAWHSGYKPDKPDFSPPGAIGAGLDEVADPVWELTENVTVAPVTVAGPEGAWTTVSMVAVPVKVLADVGHVPVWGGVHGLRQWLDRPRELGPPRQVYPDVVALALPTAIFRRATGVEVTKVAVASPNTAATTAVPLAASFATLDNEQKEAS